ncbi:23S rRNA (pseudouridine(1915)-N(3))-methyltransferase RlmH [Helicovermis profundi]|uniref:Ribosomal RNA large subunit methyltransferase H n=1 Tax=Helicovermis profundi TaxID=3065157 RepID=A0AAU9E7M0_9FIRM|nr:23S rRNA (pseudouridine(1915)-N(3))-methyltransferase RlmH [Clostridia bacterium S502]
MKITIISVGKIKEKYFTLAIEEYRKRLSRYCTLNLIEVADEKAPETLSDKDMNIVKKKEGDRILSKIKDPQHVIALAIEGGQRSSVEFAKEIEKYAIDGKSDIVFVIGGSLGIHKDVLNRANGTISFSKMTFPHQLMKVVLLEQVYRGFRIIRGEPYHK